MFPDLLFGDHARASWAEKEESAEAGQSFRARGRRGLLGRLSGSQGGSRDADCRPAAGVFDNRASDYDVVRNGDQTGDTDAAQNHRQKGSAE